MPRECAFCDSPAKKSAEHIWSEWTDRLLPGKKRFTTIQSEFIRSAQSLDVTAKVVCEQCNTTWMSEIENEHAKPVMTPLIVGAAPISISQSHADSIARFAFKTSVILDHAARGRKPFFSRFVRHGFRTSHAIPVLVSMWLAGFLPPNRGAVKTVYHEGCLSPAHRFELYVCTYAIGHLAFQVVALDRVLPIRFGPKDKTFKHLAIPFWPWIPAKTVWPASDVLRTLEQLDDFGDRWQVLSFYPFYKPRRQPHLSGKS